MNPNCTTGFKTVNYSQLQRHRLLNELDLVAQRQLNIQKLSRRFFLESESEDWTYLDNLDGLIDDVARCFHRMLYKKK